MTGLQPLSLAEQLAAVESWWREAGVDHAYLDEPRDWLAKAAPGVSDTSVAPSAAREVAEPAGPKPALIGVAASAWPQRLEDFPAWWLGEASLDEGGIAPRVPPRGTKGAELLVLVPCPEPEDSDRLLSGPQGRLLSAMLRAMGISEGDAYIASALPRHTVAPAWQDLASAGLGRVLTHHAALVQPQRIAVFGSALLPLLGHDPAQNSASVREIALEGGAVPAIAAWDLARLLESAKWRAQFWSRWLEWTALDE